MKANRIVYRVMNVIGETNGAWGSRVIGNNNII